MHPLAVNLLDRKDVAEFVGGRKELAIEVIFAIRQHTNTGFGMRDGNAERFGSFRRC